MRWRTEVEPSQDDGEDSSSQLSDGQLVCVSASSGKIPMRSILFSCYKISVFD